LCGNDAIDALCDRLEPLPPTPAIPLDVLAAMPSSVLTGQGLFSTTGAVHAAAAFSPSGDVLMTREDVGRHNAVDKVVGRMLLDGRLPATGLGLFVSGRASFELAQKAWAAGFGTLVAVSAPTALAAQTARRAGLTLAGFVRGQRLNVYAPERMQL
jgi:FdhD protein